MASYFISQCDVECPHYGVEFCIKTFLICSKIGFSRPSVRLLPATISPVFSGLSLDLSIPNDSLSRLFR